MNFRCDKWSDFRFSEI